LAENVPSINAEIMGVGAVQRILLVLNLGIFCPEKLIYKVGNSIDKNFLKFHTKITSSFKSDREQQ